MNQPNDCTYCGNSGLYDACCRPQYCDCGWYEYNKEIEQHKKVPIETILYDIEYKYKMSEKELLSILMKRNLDSTEETERKLGKALSRRQEDEDQDGLPISGRLNDKV